MVNSKTASRLSVVSASTGTQPCEHGFSDFAGVIRGVLATMRKKARKKKTASVAVHCCGRNPIRLLSGRLGRLKKLAFLQERDDWLSAASAK